MTVSPPAWPDGLRRRFKADPAAWLLRARSPLVKYRAAVDLLRWPPEAPEPRAWWGRRYEDADLDAVAASLGPEGLWLGGRRFYGRRPSLAVPRYRAAAWQLPLLVDFGLPADEEVVARAVSGFLARRRGDGAMDLGTGAVPLTALATVVTALAGWETPPGELAPSRRFLAAVQRADGGWADEAEVAADAPSPFGTTAAVLAALVSDAAFEAPVAAGKGYLLANLFSSYNGRFAPYAAAWRRFSWPQYGYDALSIAETLSEAGATRRELAPLAAFIAERQAPRGFWRQHLPLTGLCRIDAVRAGRASRWVTFRAARFLAWFWTAGESRCAV